MCWRPAHSHLLRLRRIGLHFSRKEMSMTSAVMMERMAEVGGWRRHEVVALRLDHLQQQQEQWAIVDLIGKGGHVRTGPLPDWVRSELDAWLNAAATDRGKLFRSVYRVGSVWGDGMTERAVWHIVNEAAKSIGVTDWRLTICVGPVLGSAKLREAS